MQAKPKYATLRNPSRRTNGARQAILAKGMGKPFMEWQQYVADVAGEVDDEGNLIYEIVLVTVPRQSGKTTLVGPVQIDTCVMNEDVKTFYTAQTGKDARSRFGDLVKLVKKSFLEHVVKFRYSAGDEGILFPNGSALKLFAPTESAIHGETPPLVTLDEIWGLDDGLGDAMLEDAIIPAQMTLAGRRQVWMISTAGTALSTFMKKWVDRGRSGKWPRMAYFEWGLPDGADPYDPEVIRAFHPAVGTTVTVEELLELAKGMSRGKWLRSFCNVWTEAVNPIMPFDDWDALNTPPAGKPLRKNLAITYEVAPDNECAVVMASWRDDNSEPCSRVLHAAPGTTWLPDLLEKLWREWQPAVMGADDGGETRVVTDEMRRRLKDPEGKKIRTLPAKDFGTACVAWLNYAREEHTLHQDGSRTFRNGIAHLAVKKYGDLTRFSRSGSTGPIVGPIASAVGLWMYDHKEAPLSKPVFRFAGENA